MARPKADLPPAEAIRDLLDDQGRVAVRVTPGASADSVEIADGKLHLRVRARAVDGKANNAVLALLAKAADVAPARTKLLRGLTSREKLVQIIP